MVITTFRTVNKDCSCIILCSLSSDDCILSKKIKIKEYYSNFMSSSENSQTVHRFKSTISHKMCFSLFHFLQPSRPEHWINRFGLIRT